MKSDGQHLKSPTVGSFWKNSSGSTVRLLPDISEQQTAERQNLYILINVIDRKLKKKIKKVKKKLDTY